MEKQTWKPGNMVYPLPVVMVSCAEEGKNPNIITVAWTGTVCTNPAMVYISVRKERHSYDMIKNSKEFVINLTTKDLAHATDFCGVRSGRDMNKFEVMNLTPMKGQVVNAPLIKESPVNIECVVEQVIPLGSHDMFLAKVVAVNVDEQYMDEKGKFQLAKANPIVYSHGEYYDLGDFIGTFGYSVRKPKKVDVTKSEKNSQKTMDRNLSKQSGEKAASRTAKKKKTSGKTRNKKKK